METRRNFLKKLIASSAVIMTEGNIGIFAGTPDVQKAQADITAATAPVWKGFNLLNKFNPDFQSPFSEHDFKLIARLGFNFVRIPLSYWCWSSEDNWYSINDKVLKEIDQAVEWGKQYGLHVNLNFHRVPGYCINAPKPPTNIFEEDAPLEACAFHWKTFAERYKGIPNKTLSFNLINETPAVSTEKYDRVARKLIQTIRTVDKNRLIPDNSRREKRGVRAADDSYRRAQHYPKRKRLQPHADIPLQGYMAGIEATHGIPGRKTYMAFARRRG